MRLGVDLADGADASELGIHLLGLEGLAIGAGDAHGVVTILVEGPDELLVDLADEDLLYGLHGGVIGDAQPILEPHGQIEPSEQPVDRLPAAMHEHDAHADELEQLDVTHDPAHELGVLHGRAAVLDDDRLALALVDPGQCLDEHLRLGQRYLALLLVMTLHGLSARRCWLT